MTVQSGACLDEKLYDKDIAIDAAFPFCVKKRLTTQKPVLGASWGQHGGPLLTNGKAVIRYALPQDATGAATATELTFKPADGLPAMFFYGPDGMIDLPFGPYALLSYTGSGANFPGEALLYTKNYDAVSSRAHVNGIYSSVALASGSGGRVLYSGLSGLFGMPTKDADNGLYASDLCGGSLVPTPPCLPSRKLIGWKGASGPVVSDQSGNVFLMASVSGGAHTDELYALSNAEALGSAAVTAATLSAVDTSGTSSLAAVAPTGDKPGWVLAKGYDFGAISPAYAQGYRLNKDHLEKSGALVDKALKPGTAMSSFSLFADNAGGLWVAVDAMPDKVFLQLQPRP